jgi:hypothetical protein
MIWVPVSTSPSVTSQVDCFSLTFSHELVETMTDHSGSGGITVTARLVLE